MKCCIAKLHNALFIKYSIKKTKKYTFFIYIYIYVLFDLFDSYIIYISYYIQNKYKIKNKLYIYI